VDFFEVIEKRRSIRKYTNEAVPSDVIEKAMAAAIKAPNSSNTQTWNFYWVVSEDNKKKLVEACMSQSAARTANQLIVVTANPKLWKRSLPGLIDWVETSKAPKLVHMYYKRLIPLTYRWGFLNGLGLVRWILTSVVGFFRPINRGPYTKRDMQEVAIKSAALACENFVLAITAQGYATCMMEGFDECRVSKILKLQSTERVVMVIGVGKEAERGTWGSQFRLPLEQVLHRV
jgi:nitroreductase